MNKEDIIRMAREAGLRIEFDPDMDGYEPTWFVLPDRGDTLARFAKMCYEAGAAAEREACAKVCDERVGYWQRDDVRRDEDENCAAAIRARRTSTSTISPATLLDPRGSLGEPIV
jgi:hypothetical protein